SYLAVFLPLLMTPWLIILMKNFMRTVPYEIIESGKVDGAGDFRIFVQLALPMMKPALATVGLFLALGYWNEWYLSSLYLGSSAEFKPLQYHLNNIINTANALRNSVAGSNVVVTDLPSNTLKMASAVVATGPNLLAYPYVQKYFVTGTTVGPLKGGARHAGLSAGCDGRTVGSLTRAARPRQGRAERLSRCPDERPGGPWRRPPPPAWAARSRRAAAAASSAAQAGRAM